MADWITTQQAAELTGYTVIHIRRLAATGKIKAQRWNRDWQIDRRSLLTYSGKAEQFWQPRGPKKKVDDQSE